jgi:hypothetical protein
MFVKVYKRLFLFLAYSWKSELSSHVLEVSPALGPEAHVLDATRHEFSGAPWVEDHIFNLEGHTVQDLAVYHYILGCPIHNHYHLKEVSRQSL